MPVPFDGRDIAAGAQQAYARWMAQQDVGAVALWVHTGRGLWLTAGQRSAVLETWRSSAPGLPVVCGVGVPKDVPLPAGAARLVETVTRETVRLAGEAKRGGAAAVMVHPPAAFRTLPDLPRHIVELHRAVADVGLPAIAFYLYQAAGGIDYSPELLGRILEVPGVIGIKLATLDSVMTFQDLAAAVRARPAALLITGEDRFLGYSVMLGAEAALIGMGAACTDRPAALLRAWGTRELGEFARLSAALDRFGATTFVAPVEGYIQRMLWALADDGVLDRDYHDPFGPALAKEERDRVRQAVRALRAS